MWVVGRARAWAGHGVFQEIFSGRRKGREVRKVQSPQRGMERRYVGFLQRENKGSHVIF